MVNKRLLIKRIMQLEDDETSKLLSYLLQENADVPMLVMKWLSKYGELDKLPQEQGDEGYKHESIEDNLIMEYWSRAQEIISEVNTYGGGSEAEESDVYNWLEELSVIVGEGKVAQATKFRLLDEALHECNVDNCGFGDSLTELCFELCQTVKEWEYFAEKLRARPSSRNDKILMDIFLNKLKNDKAYLELRQNYLDSALDYWELGNYYLARNKKQQALETMEKGILRAEGRCNELFEYLFDYYAGKNDTENILRIVNIALERRNVEKRMLDKLADYYILKGNYPKAKDAIIKGLNFVGTYGYYHEYKKIKNILNNDDWNMLKDQFLFSAFQNCRRDYMHICIDENLRELALQALLDNEGSWPAYDDNLVIAEFLQNDYPNEIIEYYWNKALRQIPGGNREAYRVAAQYLSRVKNLYCWALQDKHSWEKRFAILKEKFSNRLALWDEVDQL